MHSSKIFVTLKTLQLWTD